MFRQAGVRLEVFLVHPGGPFFEKKDRGVWSVPKGLIDPGETKLETACREFQEETGQAVEACSSCPKFLELGSVVQRGGKRVFAWAFEGSWPEGAEFVSNTFRLEWPPRSGRYRDVPEADRGGFFELAEARQKVNSAQEAFLDRLVGLLDPP